MSVTGRVRLHRERDETPREVVQTTCDCGRPIVVNIEHYQRVACRDCGKIYWALQPKRNGPLVLFPWPGTHEMQREGAKQAGDDVPPNYVERRAKWIKEIKP